MYETTNFRGGAEPVNVPVIWKLRTAAEWVAATGDPDIEREYERLQRLLEMLDPVLRSVVVRQRNLLQEKSEEEIIQAATVTTRLMPGCADGRPLRALSIQGIDSKFFERNRGLLTQFLDTRFEGQVSDIGLEEFLGALDESDHWLLVAPLGIGMLLFGQQRVRAKELLSVPLPGSHVLIVENESSLHQLTSLEGTVAVLGAGLNLEWMRAEWLQEKQIGYWGDMDTWGLKMLAKARILRPQLTALLMTRELFDIYRMESSVVEPSPADEHPPSGLTEHEANLYRHLRTSVRGRLEQEFLPRELVWETLSRWRQLTQ